MKGDLSNITAPPFVLGEYSTVELPQYWADQPCLFTAPALEENAERRAVLVLKWFLGSLKHQQYAGRSEQDGIKKPLNAFLGELFLGSWEDEEAGETRLVSEQVSHHPPVTACHLWNGKHGIRAEGFTQQEITFSGSVSIKQKGYAILHIDKYDEDYLIPVPTVKVKGVLNAAPYPELVGTYSIISSSYIVSEITFEGKGLVTGGTKNAFEARTYRAEDPSTNLFTAKGQWNGQFSIHDARTGQEVDSFDIDTQPLQLATVPDLSEQDPWESRRAWSGVLEALRRGDMKGAADAKSEVEESQRQLRRDEAARGEEWQRVFFQKHEEDPLFEKLSATDRGSFTVDPAVGFWKIDRKAVDNAMKPYHGDLLPTGRVHTNQSIQTRNDGNGAGNCRDSQTTEQELRGERNGAAAASDAPPQEGRESQKLQEVQVEEMLRNKYQSATR